MKKNRIQRLAESIEADVGRETKIILVTSILAFAWRRETSRSHDSWLPGNPAQGQSDATALLVCAKLGGEIRRSEVPGYGAYYYNVLADGRRLDLTRAKFPAGTVIPDGQPVEPQALLASDEAKAHHLNERLSLLIDSFDRTLSALERQPGWTLTKNKTPT